MWSEAGSARRRHRLAGSIKSLENEAKRRDVNDEAALIQSSLSGDSSAFGVLAQRYQDRLYSAMIPVVGSADEAEDVVQEAMIQAYLKLDTFQHNSRFFTWLYRIAFNYALSRRRKNRGHVSIEQARETSGIEPLDDQEGPEGTMMRDDSVRCVQLALQQLSDDHRVILVLREMQDLSYEEIADILSIEIGTVRSRLNRARLQLKVQLEQMSDWRPPEDADDLP